MKLNSTDLSSDGRDANSTSIASKDGSERWWLPLAIALPVCLIGIVLITLLVLFVITWYRSNFTYKKENSDLDRKLNDETVSQTERRGNGVSDSTYANMDETVRKANGKSSVPIQGNHHADSNGGSKIAKAFWSKTPWRRKNGHGESFENGVLNSGTDRNSAKSAEEEIKAASDGKTDFEAKPGTRIDLGELNGKIGRNKSTNEISKIPPENNSPNGQIGIRRVRNQERTEDLDKDQTKTPGKPSQAENRKTFVVMYPMESRDDAKLPLSVNDVIFFLDEENDGWMKGEKKESGEVGWFPRSHVREGMSPLAKRHSLSKMEGLELSEVKPIDFTKEIVGAKMIKEVTTKTDYHYNDTDEDFDDDDDDDDYETGIEYQALYPYRELEEGDLNFDPGDVIVVVEKLENGWWRGYRGDDQGYFPGSYVQPKCDEDMDLKNLKDVDLSPPTDDASRSVTELLPISASGEEVEDEEDVRDKKKKNAKGRRSLGLFLMSIPRKMAVGKPPSAGASGVSSPMAAKTKKGDRAMPWVKKKRPNLPPLARRCSLAPAPPSSEQNPGCVAGNGGVSSVAQMAAEAAQERHALDTTYEEIGAELEAELSLNSGAEHPEEMSLEQSISRELKARINGEFYENLGADDQTTNRRTGQAKVNETPMRNKTSSHQPFRLTSAELVSSGNLLKPVPPGKPNFSGSTPNIEALLNSSEHVVEKRAAKPKPLAKPQTVVSSETRPKPLTTKPKYLKSGFPEASGAGGLAVPTRRELGRSLDSVLPGADAGDEGLEEGELEIVKWLQKKLSAGDEEVVVPRTTKNAEPPNAKHQILLEDDRSINSDDKESVV